MFVVVTVVVGVVVVVDMFFIFVLRGVVTGARWLWGVWIKNRFQVEGMRYGPPSPIQPLRSYWPSIQPVTPKHNAVRDVTDEVMGGLGNSLMITVGMQTPIWWPQNIWTRIHSNISNWLVVNSQILNTRFCLRFFGGVTRFLPLQNMPTKVSIHIGTLEYDFQWCMSSFILCFESVMFEMSIKSQVYVGHCRTVILQKQSNFQRLHAHTPSHLWF